MSSAPALAVTDLRKSYGPTRALDGVTLEVGAGRVHAILGENGAGKSTLVRVLSGLSLPDDFGAGGDGLGAAHGRAAEFHDECFHVGCLPSPLPLSLSGRGGNENAEPLGSALV